MACLGHARHDAAARRHSFAGPADPHPRLHREAAREGGREAISADHIYVGAGESTLAQTLQSVFTSTAEIVLYAPERIVVEQGRIRSAAPQARGPRWAASAAPQEIIAWLNAAAWG